MNGYGSHIPSPPASQPASEPAQSASAAQIDSINRLRDEKDRLVNDKDRLLAEKDALVNEKLRLVEGKGRAVKEIDDLLRSKAQLWQEYYHAVKDKDEEVKQLTDSYALLVDELADQKKKNRRLAKHLSAYMDKEDLKPDVDESIVEDEVHALPTHFESVHQAGPVLKGSTVERTSSWLETVEGSTVEVTEARKQMEELFSPATAGDDIGHRAVCAERPRKRARQCTVEGTSADGYADRRARLTSQCIDITHSMSQASEVSRSSPGTPPPPGRDRIDNER